MKEINYDVILNSFNERYRKKKKINLIISFVIGFFGISSFVYGVTLEPPPTIFRYMTVDGTLFTTTGALLFLGVNLMELYGNTELTSVAVYYIRLSCAVAEMVIFTVVLFSQIPVFTQHLPVFDRYDSFVMHLVLPILTISSSYVNPLGLVLTEKWQWLLYLFIRLLLALTLMLLLLLLQNSYCKKRRAKRTAAHRTRFR